jgi:NhaA family Na+:H+ antiporter
MAENSSVTTTLPDEPIDRLVAPLTRFLHVEAAGGIVLLACAVLALVLANSPLGEAYLAFWSTEVGFTVGGFEMVHSLKHWINDGLMAVFFFVIGLEVKRELVLGELRDPRRAILPIAAALGGMIVPAAIYLALQGGEPGQRGWGIPMATDIAFVVGAMAILGRRVPSILRVFLLSLAIVDDIGAILVIAIGYTEDLNFTMLLLGLAGIVAIWAITRLGVRSYLVLGAMGILVWFGFHESGVHATIAGVILGLMIPAHSYVSAGRMGMLIDRASDVLHGGAWDSETHRAVRVRRFQRAAREFISPLEYLEDLLHPWVSFAIMPVFALANAGVQLELADLTHPVATAVTAGLFIGKPLGIALFSWLAVKLILKTLPEGLTWSIITGGGFLAGIGFTMALFIDELALTGELREAAKVGVIGGSVLAAVVGMTLLLLVLPKGKAEE